MHVVFKHALRGSQALIVRYLLEMGHSFQMLFKLPMRRSLRAYIFLATSAKKRCCVNKRYVVRGFVNQAHSAFIHTNSSPPKNPVSHCLFTAITNLFLRISNNY